jgi:hypothetical protein
MSRSAFSLTAFLFASCFLIGCGGSGPPNLQLKGKITVKGELAQNVTISLHSKDGQVYTGKTGDDGTFIISGAVPGEMVVTISSSGSGGGAYQPGVNKQEPAGGAKYGANRPMEKSKTKSEDSDPKMKERLKEEMQKQDGKMPQLPSSTKISAKYSSKDKSGLTWNVGPEQTTKDFDLPE